MRDTKSTREESRVKSTREETSTLPKTRVSIRKRKPCKREPSKRERVRERRVIESRVRESV
jgi:hypothetical protein